MKVGVFAVLVAGALLLAAPAAGAAEPVVVPNVTTVDVGIDANGIAYDRTRGVLYASVGEDDPVYANRVVAVDTATGTILRSLGVGPDPGIMAIADDASYLYVGLGGEGTIVRIALPAFVVDLEISLGEDVVDGPYYARDIEVLPGEPTSIAVVRRDRSFHSLGTEVWDGAVPRPNSSSDGFQTPDDSIIFGGPGILYGSETSSTAERFFVNGVDADGVTRLSQRWDLSERQSLDAVGDDKVFASRGLIIDVSGTTPRRAGRIGQDIGAGAVDYLESTGTVFVTGDDFPIGYGFGPWAIEEYDPDTFARLRRFEMRGPNADRPGELIAIDGDTFTLRTWHSGNLPNQLTMVYAAAAIEGTVTDAHTGWKVWDICVVATPFGDPSTVEAEAETDDNGHFSLLVRPGTYQIGFVDCGGWDYAAQWYGETFIEPVIAASGATAEVSMALTSSDLTGLVNPATGEWHLASPRSLLAKTFVFGDPGDFPMMGDWDCDGTDTPGLYRRQDGFVYLRNKNSTGNADIRFFFGDPGDLPLAGDFDGDGCDTVSIYRPAQAKVFIINDLGANEGGLGKAEYSYVFGNPGDKPFVGDFDGDGIDTVGLHRESTGLVYFRNRHSQGNADAEYVFGDPGDRLVAGNFSGFWVETPALFRPSERTFYIRHTNTQGNADRTELWDFAGSGWLPVAGAYGLPPTGHGQPLDGLESGTGGRIESSDGTRQRRPVDLLAALSTRTAGFGAGN